MELNNEISGMMKDVNELVSKHMCKMMEKMKETKKAEEECLEFIKSIPFVKKLINENEKLKNELRLLNCHANIQSIHLNIKDSEIDNSITNDEIIESIKNIQLNNDTIQLNEEDDDLISSQYLKFSGLEKKIDDDEIEKWNVVKSSSDESQLIGNNISYVGGILRAQTFSETERREN